MRYFCIKIFHFVNMSYESLYSISWPGFVCFVNKIMFMYKIFYIFGHVYALKYSWYGYYITHQFANKIMLSLCTRCLFLCAITFLVMYALKILLVCYSITHQATNNYLFSFFIIGSHLASEANNQTLFFCSYCNSRGITM